MENFADVLFVIIVVIVVIVANVGIIATNGVMIVVKIVVIGVKILIVIVLVCAKNANMIQMNMEKVKKYFVIAIKLKDVVLGVINLWQMIHRKQFFLL